MKKKPPLLTIPLSIDTLNKFGAMLVINLLLKSAQLTAHKCRVHIAIGEARNATERELEAGLLDILNDMPIIKPKGRSVRPRDTARNKPRGIKQ